MIDDSQLVATLLEEGLADQATVDRGLRQTETSGKSLYETLMSAQLVDEPELVGIMARLLDIPIGEIDAAQIPREVWSLVPASMAHRNRVLPLEREKGGALRLAMTNPEDHLALDEIAMHTGIVIKPVIVGPAMLSAALSMLYPSPDAASAVAEAVLDAFDDFEVGDYMDDVMPGEAWSDYFDEESPAELEDSGVLSRDMQDRPSTDVLAEDDIAEAVNEEEELPEIEIIEELGQPIRRRPPSPYASLDNWEVDDAIEGASEILTAGRAEDLFGPTADPAEPAELVDAIVEEEADETSNLVLPDEISESHTDALETHSGSTAIGVGVDHLADAHAAGSARAKKKKRITVERTGRTSMGLPRDVDDEGDDTGSDEEQDDDTGSEDAAADAAADSAEAARAAAEARELRRRRTLERTDYGALGRAILKSGPSNDERPDSDRTADQKPDADGDPDLAPEADDELADDATNVGKAPKEKLEDRDTLPRGLDGADVDDVPEQRKSNTSIVVALFEDDEEVIPAPPAIETRAPDVQVEPEQPHVEPSTRPRLVTPAITLPDDIDGYGLALALANLLVSKGILTTDEIFKLARSLTPKKK